MFYLLWDMVWKLEQLFAHWSILGLIIVAQLDIKQINILQSEGTTSPMTYSWENI